MNKKHRNKLMFWWSLGAAAGIALFWAIYWYITKEVPGITEIKVPFIFTWGLPFAISRWWDVLLGPIYSVILIQIMGNFEIKRLLKKMGEGLLVAFLLVENGVFFLDISRGLLLNLWLVSGIVYGLIGGVIGGLVIELFLGIRAIVQLIISLITDKKFKKILQQQELARQQQEQQEENAYQKWLRRNRKQAPEQEITPQQLTPEEEEAYQEWLARNRGLFQH